jgi:hypothetical protein
MHNMKKTNRKHLVGVSLNDKQIEALKKEADKRHLKHSTLAYQFVLEGLACASNGKVQK